MLHGTTEPPSPRPRLLELRRALEAELSAAIMVAASTPPEESGKLVSLSGTGIQVSDYSLASNVSFESL